MTVCQKTPLRVPAIASVPLALFLACAHTKPGPERFPAPSPEPRELTVESRPCSRYGHLTSLDRYGTKTIDLGQGYDLVLVDIDYDHGEAILGLARHGEVVKKYPVQKGSTLAFLDFGVDIRLDSILPLQLNLWVGDCTNTRDTGAVRFDYQP